jgi:hypothetical protein
MERRGDFQNLSNGAIHNSQANQVNLGVKKVTAVQNSR